MKIVSINDYRRDKQMTAKKYDYDYDDAIKVMTYNDWEEAHDAMERRRKTKALKFRKAKAKYFQRQRKYGLYNAILGVLTIGVGKLASVPEIGLIGLLFVLMGIYIMNTKNMVLVDWFFLKCQDNDLL